MDQSAGVRDRYAFLSYASADRERALRIADLLEARGVSVWIDRKSIVGGSSWSAEIVRGIRSCRAFLVACTPSAVASKNVQQEIQVAFESNRPIVPLMLEPTDLPESVVYALAGRQWIDVRDTPDDVWLPRVLRALAALNVISPDRIAPATRPVEGPPAPATPAPIIVRPPATHNLPIPLTSFIGRERELVEVKSRLEAGLPEARLLTLTGTGGCGKTRLALQVARDLVESYPDGVWLVELAPLSDPALVAQTVASTLDVHAEASRPILTALVDALRSRRLLLILDNCEHLIDPCARLADALLRSCPDVQILATSRESLGIDGEVSWRIPSLEIPTADAELPVDELVQNECVRLFAERARTALPGFSVTSQNASAVVQICRRLDGIPLALELAAARLKGLSVEQLASRLDQRFRLLTGGSRAALPRQQTLAALVSWSYDLLTDQERILFNRLAVFVGGWTLEAAEVVCGDEGVEAGRPSAASASPEPLTSIPSDDVLDLLLRLVDKSLVVAEPGDEGADRYRLLETLRQYALEHLAASGEGEVIRARHAGHYLQLAEEGARELWGPQLPFWWARLQLELNNVRAALRWAIDPGDVEHALRLCGALGGFLQRRAQPGESRRWLAELLAAPAAAQPTAGRGRALLSAGVLAWDQLELEQADALLDEALSILRARADQNGIVQALWLKARVAIARGAFAGGRALAEEALAIGQATGDAELGLPLHVLGQAYFYLGDYPAARACFEQDIAARGSAEQPFQAPSLNWLGNIATACGDYATAGVRYAESMRLRLTIDRKIGVAFTLSGLAGLATAQGQLRRSVRISGAASRLCELSGVPSHRTQEGYIRGRLPGIREALGAAAYDAAWAEGRAMTLAQAVAYGLAAEPGAASVGQARDAGEQ
jgi:predicted ATPase